MGQVDGKIAVVTGGASGIGAACAETLAREGAKVVLTDIDDARGQEIAAGIRSVGGEALYLSLDVTDETHWQKIVLEFDRPTAGLTSWSPMPGSASCAPRLRK